MSDEEEKKSLLPAEQQSSSAAYGSVTQEEGEDEEGRQGDDEETEDQPCWVSRHKILTAVVILTAWTCIGITIFLVLFLKVITLDWSRAGEVQYQPQLCGKTNLENINQEGVVLYRKEKLHEP